MSRLFKFVSGQKLYMIKIIDIITYFTIREDKKKIILFLLVSCFLGATLIPAVQADDPNYVTYGEVLSSFRASLGSVEIIFHNGVFYAAPFQADWGQINPFGDGWFYNYYDAHIISFSMYFEVEDHALATFYADAIDLKYYLQGPNDDVLVELPALTTALSRRIISWWDVEPNDGTGWRIAWGVPFHQQELPIGEYTLITDLWFFGDLAWHIPINFAIV